MARDGFPKIDHDATADQHFEALRCHRELYLSRALKQFLPIPTRLRIVNAALRYLESRGRQSQSSQPFSQTILTQGPVATSGPLSNFQCLLASLLTEDLSPETLIDTSVKAADGQFLPILEKSLCLLAAIGSISDKRTFNTAISLHTQEDQLFTENGEENKDPQLPIAGDETVASSANTLVIRRTGQGFVDEFVCKLIEGNHSRESEQAVLSDIFVVSVARDAPLSHHAAQVALSQLTYRMHSVQLMELPAFIYQLLLYASSRATAQAKSDLLMHIARVFAAHEEEARRSDSLSQNALAIDEDAIVPSTTSLVDLRQIQGTALLHIEYVVKQDPSLSGEIIKLVKAGVETPRGFLTSFGIGIVLSLAKSVSFRTDVLQILRDVVLKFDKERMKRKQNLFMARVTMNDEEIINPRNSLVHIAECTCENGWDYVKESLLQFAIVLLDKPLPSYSEDASSESLTTLLFWKLFAAHPAMRGKIIEQLNTRIALQEKSADQAIAILRTLGDKIPYFVLEHLHHIRDGIEIMVTLPPCMAASMMRAYKPLLAARQDLQDYFHLVIRKSLFHRDVSSRAVSIIGFLTFAHTTKKGRRAEKQFGDSGKRSLPSSRRNEKEMEFILESLQPLRRVFSYPAALKAFLYMSAIHHLTEVDSEKNASIVASSMSEIFQNHLRRFVEVSKAPYLLLDMCVGEDGLVEPLGDLMWCLAVIESYKDPKAYKASYMIDLAKKIACVSTQDFGITKDCLSMQGDDADDGDFSETNKSERATVRAARIKVRVLGCICESLIHAVLIIPREYQKWSLFPEVVVPLLAMKGKLIEMLIQAGGASPSDAFFELGGIPSLEKLRPGMRLMLQRTGKAGSSGKKVSRKGKSHDQQSSVSNPSGPSHRFGVFNILASASSRPMLPLSLSIRLLQQMSEASEETDSLETNEFKSHATSRDFQEARVYLLTVAQKHLEGFVAAISKTSQESNSFNKQQLTSLMQSIKVFVEIVMNDFKKFRRSAPDISGQGGLKALQCAESCSMALPHLTNYKSSSLSSFCRALTPKSSVFDQRDDAALFETAVELLEELINTLIDSAEIKEVGVTMHIRDMLVKLIARTLATVEMKTIFLTKRIRWSIDILSRKKIGDSSIVKTFVYSCLLYTENNIDLRHAGEVCERLLQVLGDCDDSAVLPDVQGSPDDKLTVAIAIEQDTCLSVVEAVLDVIDNAITDVEWCLNRMVCLEAAVTNYETLDSNKPKNDTSGENAKMQQEAAKQAIRAEDAALLRLEGVIRSLRGLTRCAIGRWALQERVVRQVTKAYKVLSLATNVQVKRKGDPRTSFTSLIDEVKGLAPTLWTYLAFIGADSTADQRRKSSGKAAREARIMPQLVYEVEKFEKLLINAQKRTKISLLRGMRRNIARDFRIREDLLQVENDEEEDGNANGYGVKSEEQNVEGKLGRKRAKKRRVAK